MAKLQPASHQRASDSVSPALGICLLAERERERPQLHPFMQQMLMAAQKKKARSAGPSGRRTFQMSSASNLFKKQLIHVNSECKIQPLLIKLDSVHHKQPHTSNRTGIHLYLTFSSSIRVRKRPSPSPPLRLGGGSLTWLRRGCNSPCSGTNLAPLQGAVKRLP